MSEDRTKPRKDPRKRDTTSHITITCNGGFAEALAERLAELTTLHHLNRVYIEFVHPDGAARTYTVWPVGYDEEEYRRRVEQLNWSEH